ncbi:MAG: hypothetical protein A2Y94_01335 [Caldithrix sp. RBG_13_44_9]|nr:MAG: hypothetical protein A2Y94_01335 [Caldithrix sp. RBG_13_44_9]
MQILLVILISYLLGSIPSAYILGRLFYKEDVRKKGSGNVGTLNFLRVTQSKILAVVVLTLDAAKGYAALWGTVKYAGPSYLLLSSIAVILGHIFPVWLNWRGGRGLATLAGIFIFLKPVLVIGWWLIFGVLYLLLRKYVIAGMVALFIINLLTGFLYPKEIFLILSANSVIVYLKYISRIKQELNDHK